MSVVFAFPPALRAAAAKVPVTKEPGSDLPLLYLQLHHGNRAVIAPQLAAEEYGVLLALASLLEDDSTYTVVTTNAAVVRRLQIMQLGARAGLGLPVQGLVDKLNGQEPTN